MKIKALAKNGTTGVVEWYENVYTDGDEVYFDTPNRGMKKLKDPQQIWVTLGSEREYQCVYDLKTINPSETESNKESVELVKFYDVQMVLSNPDKFYIFGDNLAGWGKGGQAIIRDCPNAIGIPTKIRPSMHVGSFFSDLDNEEKAVMFSLARIDEKIAAGYTIVLPIDGIGTGLAKMPECSPKIFWQITNHLKGICPKYLPNVVEER